MPRESKHQDVSQALRGEIAAGRYAPSGRMPSEAQLVKRFNVSRPTVGRALRDLQAQGLIERRAGSGTFVRSEPPSGETQPAGRRQFGVLIPARGTTEIFDLIAAELAQLARGGDDVLLWEDEGNERGTEKGSLAEVARAEAACRQLVRRRVGGVFFAPFEQIPRAEEVNRRLVERLRQSGAAVVLLDRDLRPFPSRSEFDLVGIDNYAAGYVAAEHLSKLGSRRVVFVARPLSPPTIKARVAGAREAMSDHGLRAAEDFVQVGDPEDPAFIERLTEPGRIDAALCANDQTAAALIRSLGRRGVRVPADVRVVGFDDVRLAEQSPVPLTTVHQPCREIAVTAFRAMFERVAEPALPARTLSLTPRLVVRESCGAYLKRDAR